MTHEILFDSKTPAYNSDVMKKIFPVVLTALVGVVCIVYGMSAYSAQIPFSPELQDRLETYTLNSAHNLKQTAIVEWDYAQEGGASTAPISLGVTIPANAIVVGGWYYVDTAVTDSGPATYDLVCGSQGIGMLPAAVDLTSLAVDSFRPIIGGSTGGYQRIGPDPCDVSLYIAATAASSVTAGKVTFFVEYLVHGY